MKIEVYKPDGTFYVGFQGSIPPVTIEIPNPDEGQWTFNVTVDEKEGIQKGQHQKSILFHGAALYKQLFVKVVYNP